MNAEDVLGHLALVPPIARRVKAKLPDGFDLEDLVQAGMVGLLKAARSYDPARCPFSFWARLKIRAEIIQAIRGEAFRYACSERALPEDLAASKPEEPEEPGEEAEVLAAALMVLSEEQRAIVAAVYEEGRSLRSVSRSGELGLGRRRVLRHHDEALGILRRFLEANGVRAA